MAVVFAVMSVGQRNEPSAEPSASCANSHAQWVISENDSRIPTHHVVDRCLFGVVAAQYRCYPRAAVAR